MTQKEQSVEEHGAHHYGCGFCDGDESAIQRQEAMVQSFDDFEAKVVDLADKIKDKTKQYYETFKRVSEPYSMANNLERIEKIDARLTRFMLNNHHFPKESDREPIFQLSSKQKKGIMGATVAASQIIIPTSAAVASQSSRPLQTINRSGKPTLEPLKREVFINIAGEMATSPEVQARFSGIEASESGIVFIPLNRLETNQDDGHQEVTSENETKEAVPQEFPNAVTIDVSKFNRQAVNAIARAINKEIPEGQTIVTINNPAVGSLVEGQNPTDIAFAMLDSADKDSKAAMYAVTHLIVAMNDIDIASGEDKIIRPGTPLFLPRETAVIVSDDSTETVDTLNSQEIEEQLNELIEAVKEIEDLIVIREEPYRVVPKPTPVSDELNEQKSQLIESIKADENNIAAIQSEAIAELSELNPDMNIDDVAKELVTNAIQNAGIEVSDEQITQIVGDVVRGVSVDKPAVDGLEASDDTHAEASSKSIVEISDELEKQLDAKRAEVEDAKSRAEALGIEVAIDVDVLSKKMISAEAKDEVVGDTMYYLLMDDKEALDRVNTARSEIANSVYGTFYGDQLLQNAENQIQIIQESAELLSQDYIDVGAYITSLEERVVSEINQGKEVALPVIAEVSNFFSEVDEISDEKLIRLAVESVDGASSDFIRMSLLQEISNLRGTQIGEVIQEYLSGAFEQAGLSEIVSEQQIEGITSLALVYWQDEAYAQRNVQLNPEEIINGMYDSVLVDMLFDNEKYLDGVDTTEIDQGKINDILLGQLQGAEDPSYYNIRFIQALQSDKSSVVQYLYDYYESNDAAYYLNEDAILVALADKLLGDDSVSPAQYIDALGGYSGNPEEIFPEGRQYILSGYEEGDLTEFITAAGLDTEKLMAHPLNDHITLKEGIITANQPTIWLADASAIDEARIKKAHDEVILGIHPPVPTVPHTDAENSQTIEKQSSNPIVSSLDNIKYEDKVNNLDNAVDAITNWYANFEDPDKDPAMPEGYVRLPSHEFFEDLNIPYTWAEKTANSEQYTSPVVAAATLAIADLYQQMLGDYPQYAGSMLRVRDLNSAHHRTHNTGTQADISTHMNAEVSQASTGPIMDYVSGDGSENDYNLQMNLDFAVKLASLRYDGDRVIRRILTSDEKLASKVNESLGFKFMSAVDYHREHWHLTFHKRHELPSFSPVSPFDELGHKGDLGIGSEYIEPPDEMVEQEHGEFNAAIDEVVAELSEEERRAEEEATSEVAKQEEEKKKAQEQAAAEKEERDRLEAQAKAEAEQEQQTAVEQAENPPGISTEQMVVAEAKTVDELVALGYSSLAKIPEADQQAFNEVLAQQPTIEEALEIYNYRQGGSKGPRVPATAVLAIAYDAGLRGDELIEAATTGSGESIGFHPYVIGDDKGARSEDDQPKQFAVGLFQFFIKNKDGVSDQQLDRGDVLLHPVANILEMVQYKNDRGFQPWYFNQNKDKQPEAWKAHRDKVLIAANAIEEGGFDILP